MFFRRGQVGHSLTACLGLTLISAACLAQEPVIATAETITINFPGEIDLPVLVDYVGKALDIHFLYGEELKSQRVELRPAPVQLPRSQLLEMLASLLRVRELGLVAEGPKLYRIVRADQSTRSVQEIRHRGVPSDPQAAGMITQVLEVPRGDVKAIAEKLERFLSMPKGGMVPVPETGQIIVTEYESRLAVLQELLRHVAGTAAAIEARTIPIQGADATGLAAQISAILAETHRLAQKTGAVPTIRSDIVPGNLVIVGSAAQVEEAAILVDRLRPSGVELTTRAYAPRNLSTERLKSLIQNVVLAPGNDLSPPVSMYTDNASGRLYISAEASTHGAIARMLEAEDQPAPQTQRPMRLYRPKYRKASEVLATISQLLGESVTITAQEPPATPNDLKPASPPGPNRPPTAPAAVQVPPMPPAQVPLEEAVTTGLPAPRVEGKDYVLTADEHTNSILAVGTREFHAHLAELIADLDERRPQVLIEMTLIAITMSDSLDLGVELESLDLGEAWDFLAFSNFGLSTINPQTGERVLIPGIGGNGVLLRPDSVPVIVRTLATRANAKVISTPKLLVSDNAQGTLRNVDEAPFTSVNASDTVATTSFAGFESAGTTLTVTPHLSEGDTVTLEYNLTFSNFTGSSGSAAIPPPRTTNSFTSTVDVPDGYTLITGGLVVENNSKAISEIPGVGRIPVIGRLFQSSSRNRTKTKIFAFIRPTVLREDEFEQLKFITLEDAGQAGLNLLQQMPGEPLWMR